MTNPTPDPQEGAPLCVTCGGRNSRWMHQPDGNGEWTGPRHPFATAGSAAPSVEEAAVWRKDREIGAVDDSDVSLPPMWIVYTDGETEFWAIPEVVDAIKREARAEETRPAPHAVQAEAERRYKQHAVDFDGWYKAKRAAFIAGAEWAQGADAEVEP